MLSALRDVLEVDVKRVAFGVMAIGTAMAIGCGGPECPVGSVMNPEGRCVTEGVDAGTDAGEPVDTGPTADVGPLDAPAVDATTFDVGPIDVGPPGMDSGADSGMPDASIPPDTAIDAFTPFDAPRPDACVTATYYADADGDTFGNASASRTGCVMPAGYVSNSMDCNDSAAVIRPGATEVCNGVDDNCAGGVDEGNPGGGMACTSSAVGNCAPGNTVCRASAVACDPIVIPGSVPEACNAQDDDCDGRTDEGVQTTYYRDADGDTYGNASISMMACTPPAAYVTNSTDCNDSSAAVNPGATEICDSIDNDCATGPDGAAASTWCDLLPQRAPLNALSAACVAGACQQTSCAMPFDHCLATGNRCETNTSTDPTNCNGCGNACNWNRCSASMCDDAVQIQAGGEHACAIRQGGTVVCWGRNTYGQLGNGTTTNSNTPVAVTGLTSIAKITVGLEHSCALSTTGVVSCWGRNQVGQLGVGSGTALFTTPQTVTIPASAGGVFEVQAGDAHTCARNITNVENAAGNIYCWGSNTYGQLGNGTTIQSTSPVPSTIFFGSAQQVAVGAFHVCAALMGRTAPTMADPGWFCWGANWSSQLGNGPGPNVSTPTRVTAFAWASALAPGDSHTCFIRSGVVQCVGSNGEGQLGNGTFGADQTAPVSVLGLTGSPTEITAGWRHSCARIGGAVQCWGLNRYGTVGNGTTTMRLTRATTAIATGTAQISAGTEFNCALSTTRRATCWGQGTFGQIGNGGNLQQTIPTVVLSPP